MASSRLYRMTLATGALAVAVTAGALAIPRLLGEGSMLLSDRIVLDIHSGRAVSRQAVELLRTSRDAAIGYVETGQAYREAALAYDKLAQADGYFQPEGRLWLAEAIYRYRESLTVAPISPAIWARLAHLQWLMNGAGPEAAASVEMSLRTGPHWPEIAMSRLELAVILLPAMSAEQRRLVATEVRRLEEAEPALVGGILSRWNARGLLSGG